MLGISGADVIVRLIAGLAIFGLFGYFSALVAIRLGDPNPGYDGRLTLNPAAHTTFPGLFTAVIAQTGWIRPLAPDLGQERARYLAATVFPLAMLGATIVVVRWLGLPVLNTILPSTQMPLLLVAADALARQTGWFIAMNLLPLPPLAGGLLLQTLHPPAYRWCRKRQLWIALAICAACLVAISL